MTRRKRWPQVLTLILVPWPLPRSFLRNTSRVSTPSKCHSPLLESTISSQCATWTKSVAIQLCSPSCTSMPVALRPVAGSAQALHATKAVTLANLTFGDGCSVTLHVHLLVVTAHRSTLQPILQYAPFSRSCTRTLSQYDTLSSFYFSSLRFNLAYTVMVRSNWFAAPNICPVLFFWPHCQL